MARLLDRTLAIISLILLAPLLLAIAAAVKFKDGGPVFYRARRVGKDGRLFNLLKFRTMVVGADRQGPGLTTSGDPRITPLGSWLRRSKLDELPQLLNVLLGDIRLVGPRPEDPRYVALYTPEQRRVLSVLPGITSPASLAYRQEERLLLGADGERMYREEVMPAKLAIELAYDARRTLWSDLHILLRTALLVLLIENLHSSLRYLVSWPLRLRNRHFLALDLLLFLLTPGLALALRLDGLEGVPQYSDSLVVVSLSFLVIKIGLFYRLGLYTLYWRYASIDELAQIVRSGLLATLLQVLLFFAVLRPAGLVAPDFPRSLPLLDSLLAIGAVGALRYSVRLSERMQQRSTRYRNSRRVLIVGAGEAGVLLAQSLQSRPQLLLLPVGFIDDDPRKQGMKVRGLSVLGNRHAIPNILSDTGASLVLLAMPSAAGRQIREIVSICERAGVQTKILPDLHELLNASSAVRQLRSVQIEDLLRREPVQTDSAAMAELLRGKRVLVTGAGGSIGSELCRQIMRCAPAELLLLGHGENSIFEIYGELQQLALNSGAQNCLIRPLIADTRFAQRIEQIFQQHQPQIVFHAAAHKHVPLMEFNPSEAISNNVIGTRSLLDAALASGVEHFVMISTDKAVNPTSIMGASKRVAELLVLQAAQLSGRPYVAVRFGNVLGSRGSVIHTFRQQINAGGPVTVTHPDMRRYFMTISEAVQLVLQAAVLGRGGEVFMLDMGEPIKIADLARDMIELSGLEIGKDIEIVFSGLRPGEKLFEELLVQGEEYQPTRHHKVFIAQRAANAVPLALATQVIELEQAACAEQHQRIVALLEQLVPEFQPAYAVPAEQAALTPDSAADALPSENRNGPLQYV